MRFVTTELPGVLIVEPDVHRDERGFFLETFHREKYRQGGIDAEFVQDNHSRSAGGVLRGLHAQSTRLQGKLVRVVEGEIFDVAVDIRRGSPTFLRWVGERLSAENFRQLFIPPGFAHGFCVLSEHAQVEYKCTEVYLPEDEITIAWWDPAIGIAWPLREPRTSKKDAAGKTVAELERLLPRYRGRLACAVTPPLTPQDLAELEQRGIPPGEAERQLVLLEKGPRPIRLLRPCTLGDGIRRIDADDPALLSAFRSSVERGRLTRFVPASGAASRMFGELQAWLESGERPPSPAIERFLDQLERFPFLDDLRAQLEATGRSLEELRRRRDAATLLHALLDRDALGLAERPKALLPFHRSEEGRVLTAFEEHLAEAAELLQPVQPAPLVRAHFTVSPQHRGLFEERWRALEPELASRGRFEVSFSEQSPATDTLALDPSGAPLRQPDGRLVWRPGGHGALIRNLGELARRGADLVMIKNVDNVKTEAGRAEGNRLRRALVGLLVSLQAQAQAHAERLVRHPTAGELEAAARFLCHELHREAAEDLLDQDRGTCRRGLLWLLDRPLRVCGMVPVQGEPGGGPFWVTDQKHPSSLQIVETSQIDRSDPRQVRILERSTHFNPVELYCALRRSSGSPYDLETLVDHETSFISRKPHEGREVVVLERPGLWNGAMASWNTVFVELPAAAFAPVKTVFDLLRPEHQT